MFLQPLAAGLAYDGFGRITTLPAGLAGSTGNGGTLAGLSGSLTVGYYVTDAVASQSQMGHFDTWTLDPAGRRRVATLDGTNKTNHYDDSSDSPAWIDEGAADHTVRRYVDDLAGEVIAVVTSSDVGIATKYQLNDLHGDVVQTSSPAPSGGTPDGSILETDEYGIPFGATARYAWLGQHQRSQDSLGGTLLMGARVYLPNLGRFLSGDAVYGGNEGAYTYPLDPVNSSDLNGNFQCFGSSCNKFGSCSWRCTGAAFKGGARKVNRIVACIGFIWGCSSRWGTVSVSGGFFGSIGYSATRVGSKNSVKFGVNAGGVNAWGSFPKFPEANARLTPGASITWSPGGFGSGLGGIVCYGLCVGYSKNFGPGWSPAIGFGTPGVSFGASGSRQIGEWQYR